MAVLAVLLIAAVVTTNPYAQDASNTALNDFGSGVIDFHTSIGEGIRQIGDTIGDSICDISTATLAHKHHNDPKYLGGDPNGKATEWEDRTHWQYHGELDKVFPRQAGKKTYEDLDEDLRRRSWMNSEKITLQQEKIENVD